MKRYLAISAVSAVMVMASLTGCTKEKTAAPAAKQMVAAESKPAPEIVVTSLNNQKLALSSLKGKVVLLNFWATWCPPCREEIPSMMKLNNVMAGKPFQMVAVSIDEGGKPAVEQFFKESGFSLPAYLDPDNQGSKLYGITGVPETFVIDKQGVVVKKIVGPLAWDSPEAITFLEGLMK